MASENNFVQATIPHGHYDHWSMLIENFLKSHEFRAMVVSGVAIKANLAQQLHAQRAQLGAIYETERS